MKTAIVHSGGGLNCAEGAGITYELMNQGLITDSKKPDIVIAGSGGSGTASYQVANQVEGVKDIWTKLLSNKGFLNRARFWKIMDIDYLIDIVFKEQFPLDLDALNNSGIQYLISATNALTGELVYFDQKEDVFEAMRASMSLWLVYGRRVPVSGTLYRDSNVSSRVPLNIRKAEELGAKKILVIDTSTGDTGIKSKLYQTWLLRQPRAFRENHRRLTEEQLAYTPKPGTEVYVLKPSDIQSSPIDNAEENMRRLFLQGRNQVKNNRKLHDFLKDF